MRTAVILGLTGSIGSNAIRALNLFEDMPTIIGGSTHTNVKKALQICRKYKINNLCITSTEPISDCSTEDIKDIEDIKIYKSIEQMLSELEPDIVLNGISGSAGFKASIITARLGLDLALANKETVVLGGNIFLSYAKEHKCRIIPVDSEHSALDRLIAKCGRENIASLIITASGGPFLNVKPEELENITPEMAEHHPNWKMGKKISIDSATLANKGLELIEAHYLFGFKSHNIEVVIHPQSIVHSMVRTFSGQVYAQLSQPDMVFPIMTALSGKESKYTGENLNFDFNLSFTKPDLQRFPFLSDAYKCIEQGASYPIAYCIADEKAVSLFMNGKIKFTQIQHYVNNILNKDWSHTPSSFEEILQIEEEVKKFL